MQTDGMPISVVFEDHAMLVLDKPSGLLSVPGKGDGKQDCLSVRVQARYPDALVVHRLDMATSGLMVMARGAKAQRILSMAFASREVVKRYCAMVDGSMLTFDQIELVSRHLAGLDIAGRAASPCVGRERADLVLSGCAILDAICATWPVGRLRVADRGIREGILFDLMHGAGGPAV